LKVASLALAVGLLLAPLASNGATYTLFPGPEFDPLIFSQGWWPSNASVQNNDFNDNYIVGTNGGASYRDFFTFDLSRIGEPIVTATLLLQRGEVGSNEATETVEFFDVSTAADVLNANQGFSPEILPTSARVRATAHSRSRDVARSRRWSRSCSGRTPSRTSTPRVAASSPWVAR
jgi:hypothetical protein